MTDDDLTTVTDRDITRLIKHAMKGEPIKGWKELHSPGLAPPTTETFAQAIAKLRPHQQEAPDLPPVHGLFWPSVASGCRFRSGQRVGVHCVACVLVCSVLSPPLSPSPSSFLLLSPLSVPLRVTACGSWTLSCVVTDTDFNYFRVNNGLTDRDLALLIL